MTNEEQMDAYYKWQKNPTKENMSNIYSAFNRLIKSEVGKYQGTLEKSLLEGYAKKFLTDAVKSFDPSTKNQLSTHIVNTLQRLHRINYKNVQGLHAPEEIQSKFNAYQRAKAVLSEDMDREPTDEEISRELGFNVEKIKPYIKFESGPVNLLQSHQTIETSPEESALDFLYHDLPPTYKKVIEYKTGYNNSPILKSKDIAKKLNVSNVRISQIADDISKKLIELTNLKANYENYDAE